MIRKLTIKDKQQVLDFAYARERENLFIIGGFKLYEDPFEANDFWGYFKGDDLVGLAVVFKRFGNFVINASDKSVLEELVDYVVETGAKIECIAAFKRYADLMLERLKTVHNLSPKKASKETVYILEKADFEDFSTGEEEKATKEDVDEIVWFNTGEDATDEERKKIFFHQEFILREDGKIVSKANIHGVSKNYFQIGGVGTREEYRRKGYAKQVVSSLCKHYFNEGVPNGLLFTDNENVPAQKVYAGIGFKPVDEFVIAEFT